MKKTYYKILLFIFSVMTIFLYSPRHIIADNNSTVYFNLVNSSKNNAIVGYDYDSDGNISQTPSVTINPTLDGKNLPVPLGDIAITEDGSLYGIGFTSSTTSIYKIDKITGVSTIVYTLPSSAGSNFNSLSGNANNLILGSLTQKNYLYNLQSHSLSQLPDSPARNSGDFLTVDGNRFIASTAGGLYLLDQTSNENKFLGTLSSQGISFISFGLTNIGGKILAVNTKTNNIMVSQDTISSIISQQNTTNEFNDTGINVPVTSGFSGYNVWGITGQDESKLVGGDVTANYVDENGKTISDPVVKSGNVGDEYSTEQKNIDGYTFKEVQGSATGTFTADSQTVTYVYTKNPVVGGDVTANYVDENGKTISDPVVKSGNVGDEYSTEQKNIDGYTFKEVQGSATGTFTADSQTVTYVYTKNPVTPASPEKPVIPDNGKTSSTTNNNTTVNNTTTNNGVKTVKKTADDILPKTAAEKVGVSAMFAAIILVITGGLIFKNRHNKQ